MRESEQAGRGSGIEAIIARIAANEGRVVGVDIASRKRGGIRPSAPRNPRPFAVLFYSSVVIGIVLLVVLCAIVAFLPALIMVA